MFRVERLLEAKLTVSPIGAEIARRLSERDDVMLAKLARVGLIDNPDTNPAPTVGTFLEDWLASRKGDCKPAKVRQLP